MKKSRLLAGGAVGMFAVVLCLAQGVGAQTQGCLSTGGQAARAPRTDVPVTFYDFRSDRSNPEFEAKHSGGRRPFMVDTLLDADNKPMTNRDDRYAYLNYGIRFWFRDWNNLSSYEMASQRHPHNKDPIGRNYLDRFVPVYTTTRPNSCPGWDAGGEFCSDVTWNRNDYDASNVNTAFENRVIKAKLWFAHVGNGMYSFVRRPRSSAMNGADVNWDRYDPYYDGFFPLSSNNANVYYNYTADDYPGIVAGATGNQLAVEFLSSTPSGFPLGTNTVGDGPYNKGTNPNTINFSFTMEMHVEFRWERGLVFNFTGDDDVWLFINGRLVESVDLGGIHEAVNGSVNLDDATVRARHGLNDTTKMHDFRLFYAERHSDGSSIRITTNIVAPELQGMTIDVGSGEMKAGVDRPASAVIQVDSGSGLVNLTDFSEGEFTWTVCDVGANPANTSCTGPNEGTPRTVTIRSATGAALNKSDKVVVRAEKAYTFVRISGTYVDPKMGCVSRDTLVYVGPGDPYALYIERLWDTTGVNVSYLRDPPQPQPIRINPADNSVRQFYAILRDEFGNWVQPAGASPNDLLNGRSITWQTVDADIATAVAGGPSAEGSNPGRDRGEGMVNRVASNGNTVLNVNYVWPGFTIRQGSEQIIIDNPTIIGVELGRMVGGVFERLSWNNSQATNRGVLDLVVGETEQLWVYVTPSVGEPYVTTAEWATTNIPGMNAVEPNGSSLMVRPTGTTSTGTVTATAGGWPVSVDVRVVNRDAGSMRFFTRRGAPDITSGLFNSYILPGALPPTAREYPSPDQFVTVTAGANLPIVAKMFAGATPSEGTWLDLDNLTPSERNGRWTWSFVGGNITDRTTINGATTGTATGDSVTFSSTAATYESSDFYRLRAIYTDNSVNPVRLEHVIHIMVVPDIRTPKLVLEPDRNGQQVSPNTLRGDWELTFTEGETGNKEAYAVLRDQYNNYITPSGAPIPSNYGPSDPPLPTIWTPKDSDDRLVYAINGVVPLGQGLVYKHTGSGTEAWVYARDSTYYSRNLRDSVLVKVLDYHYTDVMIVKRCEPGQTPTLAGYCPIPGDTIRITTNDDESIFVIGQRSNDGGWEDITGNWDADRNLTDAPAALVNPPRNSGSWSFNPRNTGEGNIYVSRGDLTDDVYIIITVGPPLRAEIVILTPEIDRRAGQPIQAEVRYYNRHSEITDWDPTWISYGALFVDTLVGMGHTTVDPTVTSNSVTTLLYYIGDNGVRSQLANLVRDPSGRTYVTFTLYNATDNPHQIWFGEEFKFGSGTGTDTIKGESPRFTLLPGAPHTVEIVVDGKPDVKDTLKIGYRDPDQVLRSVAKDEWGNSIDDIPSNWTSPGCTPEIGVPCVNSNNQARVVYRPGLATDNGGVLVCADAGINSAGEQIRDCIYVEVYGVTTDPRTAITRDNSGCGYIDAIDLKFPKRVDFTDAMKAADGRLADLANLVRVYRGSDNLIVSHVTVNPADSSAVIHIDEGERKTELQTGWTPTVAIYKGVFNDVGDDNLPSQVIAIDGAAPVIESAKLFLSSSGRVNENFIEVTFSENARSSDNQRFRDVFMNYSAADLFEIWELADPEMAKRRAAAVQKQSRNSGRGWLSRMFRGGSNSGSSMSKSAHSSDDGVAYANLPGHLDGNKLVGNPPAGRRAGDNVVWFYLENLKELSPSRHFINIKANDALNPPARSNVQDAVQLANQPKENNRKVPITYGTPPGSNAVAIPNPASPDPNRPGSPAGTINATHDPTAARDVASGSNGGTVIRVPVYVPSTQGARMRCQIKVYDLAGNLVLAGQSDRVQQSLTSENPAAGVMPGDYTDLDIYWNGYNAQGMKVAPGTYRMVVLISYSNVSGSQDQQHAKNKKYQTTVGMSK